MVLLNFQLGHFFGVAVGLGDLLGRDFAGLDRAGDFAERIGGGLAQRRIHFAERVGENGDKNGHADLRDDLRKHDNRTPLPQTGGLSGIEENNF